MARTKKVYKSTEEKIECVRQEIVHAKELLKSKKAELKLLEDTKKAEDAKKILDALDGSSRSIDEVIAFINTPDENSGNA